MIAPSGSRSASQDESNLTHNCEIQDRLDLVTIEKARSLQNIPMCEEYERMISGMRYDGGDIALVTARMRARLAATAYNTYMPPTDITPEKLAEQRQRAVKRMLGRTGTGISIEPPIFLDYGCNVIIGDDFFSNFNLTILDCALVTIGDRVMCGPSVSLLTASHETSIESRQRNSIFARPITIGNDCWLGAGVMVLPGVTIGDGCTIGAGALVKKDIPPFSVAFGSPASVMRSVANPGDSNLRHGRHTN